MPNDPKFTPSDRLSLLYSTPIAISLESTWICSNLHFKFSGQNPSRPNASQIDTRCSLGCLDEELNSLNAQCPVKMVKLQSRRTGQSFCSSNVRAQLSMTTYADSYEDLKSEISVRTLSFSTENKIKKSTKLSNIKKNITVLLVTMV